MLQRRARAQNSANAITRIQVPDFLQPGPVMPGSRGQVASHPYDCMTINCLCPYFQGHFEGTQCVLPNGQPLTMAFRKEYRTLSEEERNRYHNAMRSFKLSGEYDRLCNEHLSVGSGSGAHSGPGFLPWHREFLKRVEIGLRLIDPTVSIPYWDNIMDNYLPDPRQSILFSPPFEGETDDFGNVVTGPYAFWPTVDGRQAILRIMGMEGSLWTESTLASIMGQSAIENILHYTAPLIGCPMPVNLGAPEFVHSFIHLWVGGHMRDPPTSANDPIFYPYHAFVDFVWELWRQTHQTPQARELEYPMDIALCEDPQHFSYAPMRPYFNLVNRDGLSNMYTDQMYRYAPRPGCSTQVPTCGSPYLFCDTRGVPHCVSKIKPKGICMGFEGLDACFNSVCQGGRCVPGATPPPFVPRTQLPAAQRAQISRSQASRIFVACFNRNPCCELWARDGECRISGDYMRQFCSAACNFCRAAFNATNECADRHVSCEQWRSDGQCRGNSEQFMQENCRSSCGLCNTPKFTACPRRSTVLIKVVE
ncbi:unnamed protein product [Toxocara canis]|uniref:Putative tyrosinase-like protein tyr-1 n=1 Tax=Toxocara canis TaxID=6265 RepID=A0A183UY55_TOXCA|nr:unnamed protein product [Toxocara canis]